MKTGFSEYLDGFPAPKNRFGKELRVIYTPREYVENTILASCNGTEGKVIKKDILAKIPNLLTERQYKIIRLYYFNRLTMKETGKVLGITEARVSQIHSQTIRLLRKLTSERIQVNETLDEAV
jgi:DNA-directed RNA polymerase specialized sigma subunit